MDEITSKERILKRIREALIASPIEPQGKVDLESSVFSPLDEAREIVFAENFVRKGGRFVYCENVEIAVQSLQALVAENAWEEVLFCRDETVEFLLKTAGLSYGRDPIDAVLKKVGCSSCRYLIANDGSLMFDSDPSGRRLFAQAETMVFIASVEQVVPDLRTAMKGWKEENRKLPSRISMWTGLSRFSDVDGRELPGMGPEHIYLVLIDNIDN